MKNKGQGLFLSMAIVAFALLAVVAAEKVAEDKTAKQVLTLNQENWDEAQKNNLFLLVLFNQPSDAGCQECAIASSEILKVAKLLEETGVVVGQVDCKTSKTICEKEEVASDLPFIKLFERDLSSYDYPRYKVYADHVVEFVQQNLGPKFTTLSTLEEIEAFVHEHKISIVGFFSLGENKIISSFKRTAARLFQEFPFAIVMISNDNVAFLEKHDLLPGNLAMFKYLGGRLSHTNYDGTITRKRVTRWVFENIPWMVNEVSKENGGFASINHGKIPILSLYVRPEDNAQKSFYVNTLEKIVERFRGRLIFAVKTIEEQDTDFITTYGLQEKTSPILVIHDVKTTLVFLHDSFDEEHPFNADEIAAWSTLFLRRDLSPYHYKQPVPEQDASSAVQVLVTDNFRKFVNADTASIVFFYLPKTKCDHCYKFVAIFEEVAAKLKETANLPVQFGKIDMSANQRVPGYSVTTFPSIHFFPKTNKNLTTHYKGVRDAENLTKWILSLFPADSASDKQEAVKATEIL
eukprot:TRINITY_DN9263_c0_g1_i1.p1 TRINITY_DN9263_c0_g1~~TRINITY_DN9263_c0_g1_i1.p1  ORF type:complete len:531 (+),score=279.20 TRINITY_DN9263_c0_g1_i1:36-1595(+)